MRKIISHLKDNWIQYGFETFVVVFGILVAFSLNNWREDVKMKMEEKILLNGLQSEMMQNRKRLVSVIELHQIGANHHDSFLQIYLEDTLTEGRDFYDSLWNKTFGPTLLVTYNPLLGNVKSIISSGKLGYISNKNLARLISSFEGNVSDAKEAEPVFINMSNNLIYPLAYKYVPQELRGKTITVSDFLGFSRDKELFEYMRILSFWRKATLREERNLLSEIDKMLEMIEKEGTN